MFDNFKFILDNFFKNFTTCVLTVSKRNIFDTVYDDAKSCSLLPNLSIVILCFRTW